MKKTSQRSSAQKKVLMSKEKNLAENNSTKIDYFLHFFQYHSLIISSLSAAFPVRSRRFRMARIIPDATRATHSNQHSQAATCGTDLFKMVIKSGVYLGNIEHFHRQHCNIEYSHKKTIKLLTCLSFTLEKKMKMTNRHSEKLT